MAKPNKRLFFLLLAAFVLGGVYWYDHTHGISSLFQGGGVAEDIASAVGTTTDFGGAVPATIETLPSLYRTRADLRNFKAKQAEIDKAYFNLASTYADKISGLTGLITDKNTDDKTFIENALRARLDDLGTLEDLKINVAESEALSPKGGRKALADISFTTGSSQDAAKLMLDLGDGKNGMIWRSMSVATDRMRRQVSISGRLAIFLAEAAE
ncbi:MAG: hypothetical protein EYC62_09455 [Alphaproteobacteria bacterium]|nr:MAG: hypothetical protein EYC62_09455 [Alphaproteobacteria bacterium]